MAAGIDNEPLTEQDLVYAQLLLEWARSLPEKPQTWEKFLWKSWEREGEWSA